MLGVRPSQGKSVLCVVRTESEETVELVACNTTEHSQMAAL